MKFVDVEAMLADFFRANTSHTVYTLIPSTRPAEFVRVWRTGGGASNRILDEPVVTVQGWAPNKGRAADLTGECRDLLMHGFSGMPLVRSVESVGFYYDPDPDTGVARYSASFRLRVRAQR